MSIVFNAPHLDFNVVNGPSIFLAGSIEMGVAEDWQARVIRELESVDCKIFNPRRPDWDSSWTQSKDNPQFRQQVEWELDHLGAVDIVALYLSPGTMSPISLLELGLFARKEVVIFCPEGFWRKGNVDIVAERYGLPVYETFDPFIEAIKRYIDTVALRSL